MCSTGVADAQSLTHGQMALLQLSRFSTTEDSKIMPYGTCQDGIGLAIGITRSHTCLVLQKLMKEGCVVRHQAHIPEMRTRRLAYSLTLKGAMMAGEIKDNLKKVGVMDIETLFKNEVRSTPIKAGKLYDAEEELLRALELLKGMQNNGSRNDIPLVMRHAIKALEAISREECI